MSDFGLFEASVVEDTAPEAQARVASKRLHAAIYDVRAHYGAFLLASTGLDEFEDRWHYSKKDIRTTVEPHLMPVTGVMRRIHDALKREYKEAIRKEAPFADYKNFADCESKNQDKSHPDAYCGEIKHRTEDKDKKAASRRACKICHNKPESEKCAECRAHEARRRHATELDPTQPTGEAGGQSKNFEPVQPHEKSGRLADKTEPDQDIQETFEDHRGETLEPEGNFPAYLDSVDQGGPERVERADFDHRDGEDNWENTGREAAKWQPSDEDDEETFERKKRPGRYDDEEDRRRRSMVLDLYTDWARSNNLRVASLNTLAQYSYNCSDDEYRLIDAAIRRHAEEDDDEREDEDRDRKDEDREQEDDDEDREDEDRDEEEEEDEDEDEGDEDEDDDEDDRDKDDRDGPPWLTSRRHYADATQDPDPEDDEQAYGQDSAPQGPPQGGQQGPPQGMGQGAPQQPPGPPQGGQGPGPVENQPAEDALLDVASQAVMQMIDRETQEYQQMIDPLTQAMQAIEFAQQVEQQENPLDVSPPQGTVDVGPKAAGPQPQQQMASRRYAYSDWSDADLLSEHRRSGGEKRSDIAGELWNRADSDSETYGHSDLAGHLESRGVNRPGGPTKSAPHRRSMQQQASRIARHYGMTEGGYHMLLGAMSRKHYQGVADAIQGLPPEHRGSIAASLADMFKADNPRFRHDTFYSAAGVDPRYASRQHQAGPQMYEPGYEHGLPQIFNRDEGYASELSHPHSPGEARHEYIRDLMEEGPPGAPGRERTPWEEHPEDDWGRYSKRSRGRLDFRQAGNPRDRAGDAWRGGRDYRDQENEAYDVDPENWGDPMEDIAQGRMYQHWMNDPTNMLNVDPYQQELDENAGASSQRDPRSRNRDRDIALSNELFHPGGPSGKGPGWTGDIWGPQASRRQAAAPLTPELTLDSFEFPGANKVPHPKDNLTITPDTFGTPKSLSDIKPKKAAWDREAWAREAVAAQDLYNQVVQNRSQQGLVTDPEPTLSAFSDLAQSKGVSPKAINMVKQKVAPTPAAPKIKARRQAVPSFTRAWEEPRKSSSFFTRRVPGWKWDDHLAAYTAKTATPFMCHCGSQFDVPSYYTCRCGKTFNSYVVGSGGDDKTASIDMFLCREVDVRPDMMMTGSRKQACCDDCGHDPCTCEDVEWVTDEDREDAEAPHAPYKNARIAGVMSDLINMGHGDELQLTPRHSVVYHSGGEDDYGNNDPTQGDYSIYRDNDFHHQVHVSPDINGNGRPRSYAAEEVLRRIQGSKQAGFGDEADWNRWNEHARGRDPYDEERPVPFPGSFLPLDEQSRMVQRRGAIGEDDHSVVYRDGDRYCSKCDALLWDPNVHHCPAKQASAYQVGAYTFTAGFNDTQSIISEFNTARDAWQDSQHPDDADYMRQVHRELVDRAMGGDPHAQAWIGRDVTDASPERLTEMFHQSRKMFGDWTKYDDDLDYGGPSGPPSTVVKQPESDWARRDEHHRWLGPAIPRRR